jgi:chromosome segregation ATPase
MPATLFVNQPISKGIIIMKNQLAQIQSQLDTLTEKQAKVAATRADKSAVRDSITQAINAAQAEVSACAATLASTSAAEALEGGSADAVASARVALSAAQKALTKAKGREGEVFELDSIIAACDSRITSLGSEAVAWQSQLRTVKLEALSAELDRRINAYDAMVQPIYQASVAAVACEQLMRERGLQPETVGINLRGLALPCVRLTADSVPVDVLISNAKAELARALSL